MHAWFRHKTRSFSWCAFSQPNDFNLCLKLFHAQLEARELTRTSRSRDSARFAPSPFSRHSLVLSLYSTPSGCPRRTHRWFIYGISQSGYSEGITGVNDADLRSFFRCFLWLRESINFQDIIKKKVSEFLIDSHWRLVLKILKLL